MLAVITHQAENAEDRSLPLARSMITGITMALDHNGCGIIFKPATLCKSQ
jgi:hypothetical protein